MRKISKYLHQRKLNAIDRTQAGITMVIGAGLILVFLLVGAYAIDSLLIYLTRRELQLAADAAAHAGSVALRDDLVILDAQTPAQQTDIRNQKESAFFLAKKAAIHTLLQNPPWFAKAGYEVDASGASDPFNSFGGDVTLSYNGDPSESGYIQFVEFENSRFHIAIQRGYYAVTTDSTRQVFVNLESEENVRLQSPNIGEVPTTQLHGIESEAGVENCWCPNTTDDVLPPARFTECEALGVCDNSGRTEGAFTWDVANSVRVFIHLKEYPTFFSKLFGYNALGGNLNKAIVAVSASTTS
jgi:hypothetical protein